MTSLSTNIKLLLTGADETTMTFQEWRTAMNGIGNNSNMELIDTAIGELTKACAKKADGFVFNPETGVLQLTCEGEALEGDSTSTTIDLSRFYTKAEVDTLAEIVATEPTAQQILSIMQQEMALLNQLVESGMSDKGNLNGFSLGRGDNGELIISYVNPDDETDVAMSTLATKATANLIAQELAAINESLHTIVGAEQTTTNTEG